MRHAHAMEAIPDKTQLMALPALSSGSTREPYITARTPPTLPQAMGARARALGLAAFRRLVGLFVVGMVMRICDGAPAPTRVMAQAARVRSVGRWSGLRLQFDAGCDEDEGEGDGKSLCSA